MQEPYKTDIREIPVGSYPGKLGGYVVEFNVGEVMYKAEFKKGVRGFGIHDVISVNKDGEIYSSKLAVYAIGLKKAVWTDI